MAQPITPAQAHNACLETAYVSHVERVNTFLRNTPPNTVGARWFSVDGIAYSHLWRLQREFQAAGWTVRHIADSASFVFEGT
jgi:hypothetical protein